MSTSAKSQELLYDKHTSRCPIKLTKNQVEYACSTNKRLFCTNPQMQTVHYEKLEHRH
uniref:Uncharacterized protein n=1 Tax=Rhizophora mucronata TaxID=61149 RepID=A0A2P2NGN3_RHIMU